MCLAVPGRVVELAGGAAVVEVAGKLSRASLSLLADDDQPLIGDYVICHLGVVLNRIDEAEAAELREMLEQVAGADFSVQSS